MASVFKAAGASKYTILYHDENGRRRKKAGTTDKGVTERIAHAIEERVALRKDGLVNPRDEAYAQHGSESLLDHIDAWKKSIRSRGATPQHVKLHTSRAMRVVALIKGANLADIEPKKPATREGVKAAEDELRKSSGHRDLSI